MKKKNIVIIVTLLVLVLSAGIGVLTINQGNYEEMTGWQRTAYAILNRDKILESKYIGEVSDYTWSADEEYKLENTSIVMKEAGEDFVIMNITDLHMSDYRQDALLAIRAFDSIRLMVKKHQPDMITLSGDIFWEDSTIYSVHRLTEFMDSLEIPWAPVFGNHDYEGNCDMNYLADIMMSGEYCLMQKGDPSMGVGNYIVNICEETNGQKEVAHSVILMDTHNSKPYENQVEWYKWATKGVNALMGEDVNSTIVMHIAFDAYQYAYETAWDAQNNCWKEGFQAFGEKREEECFERDEEGNPVDSGIFAAIKEVGTTKNTICGHDHINTYSINYEGVQWTYSLRLGLGAYFDVDCQGVTLLTLHEEGTSSVEHDYRYDDK